MIQKKRDYSAEGISQQWHDMFDVGLRSSNKNVNINYF